jgi:hypothetical protein
VSFLASACAFLLMLAAESGSPVGEHSADKWRWGSFLDGFLGPALILVGMTFFVLLSLRLKKRNRDLQDLDRRSRTGGSSAQVRESLERMAVDLEEVARSISAMLDTRMRALEKLIRDADQRIVRLETGGKAEAGGAEPSAEEDAARADARRAAEKAEDTLAHHAHIYGLADQGLSVQEIAEQTGYQRGEIELVLSLRKATRPEPEDE